MLGLNPGEIASGLAMSHAGLMTQEARLARRSVARGVIIEAGRRLALRDGIDELSLSAVAAEAGFNPSTVFGHFRNKDELLLAIVAEDLGELAAMMRSTTVQPSLFDSDLAGESHGETFSAAQTANRDQPDPEPDTVPPQIEAYEPAAEADSDPEPPPSPTVDLWLERRLRIFERTLADLEQRLKEIDAAATRALALSEETAKALFDRVERFEREQRETAQSLNGRMEETERRQRGATAEMRAAVSDAATRIEILETARRADQRKPEPAPEEVPVATPPIAASSEQPGEASDQETYFAAAQRAASAAALLAGMQERAERASSLPVRPKRVRLRRKHYAFAAAVVVLAFVVGAFVAFYVGQARGHQLAAAWSRIGPAQRSRKLPPKAEVLSDPRVRLASLARSGNPKAELLLGLQFAHGDGAAANEAEGARWIRLAASQHDAVAEYYLGSLFERGEGVGRNSAEALRWYQAAAAQGNRKAMHALGIAYAQGAGSRTNYALAAQWFSKAAELGLVNSQFNLAVLYERGLGVRQSLDDAYKWYAIAAANGDQESRKRMGALNSQLAAGDLAAAKRAAEDFAPGQMNPEVNEPPVLANLLSRSAH